LKWAQVIPREKIKVIVSLTEGGQVAKAFRSWNPEPKSLKIGPLESSERVNRSLTISDKETTLMLIVQQLSQ